MFTNVTLKLQNSSHEAIYAYVVDHIENFTSEIYSRRTELRYTGQNCSSSSNWNLPSALLFTITVITTIGYGHVTPTSW